MVITGISDIRAQTHETARLRYNGNHTSLRGLYDTVCTDRMIVPPFKHFGRFDTSSQQVCLAVALAIHDSGIESAHHQAYATGILIAGTEGASATNGAYFRDYIDGGRTLGRGNLFIYTLPTSPAAEAAIHFGLTGPLLYIGRAESSAHAALADCAGILRDGQAGAMFCILLQRNRVTCARICSEAVPKQPSVTMETANQIMTNEDRLGREKWALAMSQCEMEQAT